MFVSAASFSKTNENYDYMSDIIATLILEKIPAFCKLHLIFSKDSALEANAVANIVYHKFKSTRQINVNIKGFGKHYSNLYRSIQKINSERNDQHIFNLRI